MNPLNDLASSINELAESRKGLGTSMKTAAKNLGSSTTSASSSLGSSIRVASRIHGDSMITLGQSITLLATALKFIALTMVVSALFWFINPRTTKVKIKCLEWLP